jgi:CBS domain-containing protein
MHASNGIQKYNPGNVFLARTVQESISLHLLASCAVVQNVLVLYKSFELPSTCSIDCVFIFFVEFSPVTIASSSDFPPTTPATSKIMSSLNKNSPNVLYQHLHGLRLQALVATQVTASVTEKATLEEAVTKMAEARVTCLPIVDSATGDVLSQIDTLDILQYIAKVLPDNHDLKVHEWRSLQIAGRAIAVVTVMEVADMSGRDPFAPVYEDAGMGLLLEFFSKGMHRVMVFDKKLNLKGVVSQMTVAQEVASALDHVQTLKAVGEKTISALGLQCSEVMTISKASRVYEAIRMMAAKGVSALALIDPLTGQLCGNFSAIDVEGLYHGDYLKMTMSIEEYLIEKYPQSLRPIVVRGDSTFADTIKSMVENRVHRVWVVDGEYKPMGVVSLTDIFKLAMLPELY